MLKEKDKGEWVGVKEPIELELLFLAQRQGLFQLPINLLLPMSFESIYRTKGAKNFFKKTGSTSEGREAVFVSTLTYMFPPLHQCEQNMHEHVKVAAAS